MKSTIKDEVEHVLEVSPDARADNRVLTLRIWELHGLSLTPEQWALVPSLPQTETVRRHRAKIQNEEGRFRPTL